MSDLNEFLQAISTGDLPRVESMLRDHSLATATTPEGMPVLLHALHQGHASIARAIASRLPSMTLHEAAALGDLERVRSTLALRPSALDTPAEDRNTPLGLAVTFGHFEVARTLLDEGADPNGGPDGSPVVPPLHAAIGLSQAGVVGRFVDLLLRSGADATRTSGTAWTPLHAAAAKGYREVVQRLIEHGGDPRAVTQNGKPPAQIAREAGFDSLAVWLENPEETR